MKPKLSDMLHVTTRPAALFGMAATLGLGLAAGAAFAQDGYPCKTIEVVTHAGAGGGTDVTTRMMMLRSRRELKADMVVVSKRGGGGATAMNYINGRDRDGCTIMTITPTHLLTIARGKSPLKVEDLVGLARATDDPQILMVKADSKYKSADDLLAAAKENSLKFGGTQVGAIDQITAFTFAKKAGLQNPNYIPFDGGGAIITALIGGDIEIGVLNLSEAESQISAGEIRALMVLAKKRMKPLPDVPTSVEMGIDAVFSTVRGFVTLKGAPEDRVKMLEEKLVKAMKHKVYMGYLETAGLGPDSIVGADDWNGQIQQLYADGVVALTDLGMLK
jgi:tripartite-type tricarboxylate transporter receptor subunit TctC